MYEGGGGVKRLAAGISDNLPMSRNRSWGIAARGEQKRNALDFLPVFVYIVSPGYLEAMGMRLMEGRDVSWDDLTSNRNVVIINETVARRLWPGQDPIGRIAVAGGADAQVIGVITDVRESSAEENAGAQMYLPATKQFGPEGCNLVEAASLCPCHERNENAAPDQSRPACYRIQAHSVAG